MNQDHNAWVYPFLWVAVGALVIGAVLAGFLIFLFIRGVAL